MGAEIVYHVMLLKLQAKASPTLPPPTSTSTVVCKALQKGEGPALPPPCSGHSPACRQQKPAPLQDVHTKVSHLASGSLNRIPLQP